MRNKCEGSKQRRGLKYISPIAITVNLDDGQVEYDVIGKYKRDSNEFVLFVVCDKFSDTYVACLDRALEFAQAWETQDPKGSVYDYDDLEENGEE